MKRRETRAIFLDAGLDAVAVAMLEARTGKRVSPRAYIFQSLEALARDYDAITPETRPPTRPTTPTPPPSPPKGGGLLRRVLSVLTPKS